MTENDIIWMITAVRASLKRVVERIAPGLTPLGSLFLPTESIYDSLSTIR